MSSSLLQLFSKPKVESSRGHIEPGYLPPLRLDTNHGRPQNTSLAERRSPLSKLAGASSNEPRYRDPQDQDGLAWQPPALARVYAQALILSLASTDSFFEPPSRTRPFTSRARSPSPIRLRLNHAPDGGSLYASDGQDDARPGLVRKYFALLPNGFLLQYPQRGAYNRLPEAVLYLTPDSVVVPLDSKPGSPYTLRVRHSATSTEPATSNALDAPIRLLAKLGMRNSPRRSNLRSSMLIILDDVEARDEWLVAVRKVIASLDDPTSFYRPALANLRPTVDHHILPLTLNAGRSVLAAFRRPSWQKHGQVDDVSTNHVDSDNKQTHDPPDEPKSYLFPPTRPGSTVDLTQQPVRKTSSAIETAAQTRHDSHIVEWASPSTSPDSYDSLLASSVEHDTPATSVSSSVEGGLPFAEAQSRKSHPSTKQLSPREREQLASGPDLRSKFSSQSRPAFRQLSSLTNSKTYRPSTAPEKENSADPHIVARPRSSSVPSMSQDRPLSVPAAIAELRGRSQPALRIPLKVNPQNAAKEPAPRQQSPKAQRPVYIEDPDQLAMAVTTDELTDDTDSPVNARTLQGATLSLFPTPPPTVTFPKRQDSIQAITAMPPVEAHSGALARLSVVPEDLAETTMSPQSPRKNQFSAPAIVHDTLAPHLSRKAQDTLPGLARSTLTESEANPEIVSTAPAEEIPSALPQISLAKKEVPKFATRSFMRRPPTHVRRPSLQIRTHSDAHRIVRGPKASMGHFAKAGDALAVVRKRSMTALRSVANSSKVAEIRAAGFASEARKNSITSSLGSSRKGAKSPGSPVAELRARSTTSPNISLEERKQASKARARSKARTATGSPRQKASSPPPRSTSHSTLNQQPIRKSSLKDTTGLRSPETGKVHRPEQGDLRRTRSRTRASTTHATPKSKAEAWKARDKSLPPVPQDDEDSGVEVSAFTSISAHNSRKQALNRPESVAQTPPPTRSVFLPRLPQQMQSQLSKSQPVDATPRPRSRALQHPGPPKSALKQHPRPRSEACARQSEAADENDLKSRPRSQAVPRTPGLPISTPPRTPGLPISTPPRTPGLSISTPPPQSPPMKGAGSNIAVDAKTKNEKKQSQSQSQYQPQTQTQQEQQRHPAQSQRNTMVQYRVSSSPRTNLNRPTTPTSHSSPSSTTTTSPGQEPASVSASASSSQASLLSALSSSPSSSTRSNTTKRSSVLPFGDVEIPIVVELGPPAPPPEKMLPVPPALRA